MQPVASNPITEVEFRKPLAWIGTRRYAMGIETAQKVAPGKRIAGPALVENHIGPVEVNRSIDAYILALSGIEHGSEKLPDVFGRLPKVGPLIIVVRKDNSQSEFLGMMIGYISWPREIKLIKIATPTAEKELAGINPDSISGLVFCLMDPPAWLGKPIRLGSNIFLVPSPKTG